jgi:DNA-binding MltR family transcriptional regulator
MDEAGLEQLGITDLENKSIELFHKLNDKLDSQGKEMLFAYDLIMSKIYMLNKRVFEVES